jgi:hypothetical protein
LFPACELELEIGKGDELDELAREIADVGDDV